MFISDLCAAETTTTTGTDVLGSPERTKQSQGETFGLYQKYS